MLSQTFNLLNSKYTVILSLCI